MYKISFMAFPLCKFWPDSQSHICCYPLYIPLLTWQVTSGLSLSSPVWPGLARRMTSSRRRCSSSHLISRLRTVSPRSLILSLSPSPSSPSRLLVRSSSTMLTSSCSYTRSRLSFMSRRAAACLARYWNEQNVNRRVIVIVFSFLYPLALMNVWSSQCFRKRLIFSRFLKLSPWDRDGGGNVIHFRILVMVTLTLLHYSCLQRQRKVPRFSQTR